ncbi:MAG: PDZ domain-containing protein [Planctomycetes bacterium]|nr:PDZ domain-containing protein [Planctomycetota bacterium]
MRFAAVLSCALFVMILGAGQVAAQSSDAWLGVKLEVVENADAKKLGIDGGLKVTRVDDKSPAEKAGFEVGDIVLSAGEKTITSIEQMRDVLGGKHPGDLLTLGVRRSNGRTEPLMVTLGSVKDKDNEFSDDARVAELRKRLRDLDSERRRVQEELENRLDELRKGKADKVKDPTPSTENPGGDEPEVKPETHKPDRVHLAVTIGASFVNLDAEESKVHGIEGGIRVTKVSAGGAAEEAGLKIDDIVVYVDSDAVTGTGHLRTILAEHDPGDKIEVEVIRAGKHQTLTVVLRAKNTR